MKRFIEIHYKDITLIMCLCLVLVFLTRILSLFMDARDIENQTTEGFGKEKREFTFESHKEIDFSFLNEYKDESYAILIRMDEYEPLYALVATENYLFIEEDNKYFSINDVQDKEIHFICGQHAGDLFNLNPFIYNDVEADNLGIFEAPSQANIGMEYMIFFICTDSMYLGNNRFILIGDDNSVETIYRAIKDKNADSSFVEIESNDTKVMNREKLGKRGSIIIFVALAFAVLSLIMIIYWWSMQFEEYERASILIGRKYYLIDVLREFELICIIAVLSASLICFKYVTISVINLYVLACFFSTIIVICTRTVKFEGDVYGADY